MGNGLYIEIDIYRCMYCPDHAFYSLSDKKQINAQIMLSNAKHSLSKSVLEFEF